MAGYNMTNGGSGYAFGGGGFGGLGDFGQALYFGLGQAMPMLSAVYDFQDKNALRQDAMNNAASQLRANTMDNTTNALYGLDRNNVIMGPRSLFRCPAVQRQQGNQSIFLAICERYLSAAPRLSGSLDWNSFAVPL